MKEKLTSLTDAQKAKFPEYVDKWTRIGTSTDRLDYDETSKIITNIRKHILKLDSDKVNAPLIIVDNPIEAWIVCTLFENNLADANNAISQMKKYFEGNPEGWEMPTPEIPHEVGSFNAAYFSFYDYFLNEVPEVEIEEDVRELYFYIQESVKLGMIYPMEMCTVVSQKPSEIHLNENQQLHRDGGPALKYEGYGDFNIYSLNGVMVPKYLAETPSRELSMDFFKEESNADIRAEFIRKCGIEQMLEFGKKIDTYENYDNEWWTKSEYELWDMSDIFQSKSYAPYLRMKNQTTHIWHFEGVSPNQRTLRDAIKERFGGRDFEIRTIV